MSLHPSPSPDGTPAATGATPATTRSRQRGKRGGARARVRVLNSQIERASAERRDALRAAERNRSERLSIDLNGPDLGPLSAAGGFYGEKRELVADMRSRRAIGEGAPLHRGRPEERLR